MRDYIREGLANYDAPPRIYDKICKALENPALTENERKELLEQKEKAEKMAMKTSILCPFEPKK